MARQSLFQSHREQFVTKTGVPVVNGKVYVGEPNKDPKANPIPVYSTRADAINGTNPLSQPVRTDDYGRTQNPVWTNQDYSYQVDDANDVKLLGEDKIEVVDVAAEVQQEFDNLSDTLLSGHRNAIVNGGMAVALGSDATLSGSYQQGAVTGVYGRGTNISAGALTQGVDVDFSATGFHTLYDGVTLPNSSDVLEHQERVISDEAQRFKDGPATFSALVEHDFGFDCDFTITLEKADAEDDFSSTTVIDTQGTPTEVPSGQGTRIEFSTTDMGDCSNGIAVTIKADCGSITDKVMKVSEAQLETGDSRTVFQLRGYRESRAALDALLRTNNLSDVAHAGTALGNIFTAGSGITRSGTTVSVDLTGSISQSDLNTSTGEVTANTLSLLMTLPGGEYGFFPQIRDSDGGTGHVGIVGGAQTLDSDGDYNVDLKTIGTSYSTYITVGNTSSPNGLTYAKQRYIQASPPYDLGDGEIPLFTFALVSPQGDVVSTYTAEDPPWANNGPTNTRPDVYRREKRGGREVTVGYQYRRRALSDDERKAVVNGEMARPEPELVEVDQSIKNADMDVIPHPFADAPSDHTVVLLDPVSTQGLHELHLQGESIAELLHGGYVGVDNEPLNRKGPKGVMPVGFRWKGGKQ